MTDFGFPSTDEDAPQYIKDAEAQDKVYEKTSVQFTAANPETKTLQLSPAAGKTWYLTRIKAWTNEKPPDDAVGSQTDIDVFINGTTKQIAKSYASEQIGATYRTCGLCMYCSRRFGQRLKITENTNGVYITATKTGTATHTLYLEVKGTQK